MSDVSRETSALIAQYGDVPGLARYAQLLTSAGVERGLIGPREVPRIWTRHIANCAVVATSPLVPARARVADVGSGAGLPGLVWALVRPDLEVTLIEPLLRRATFLSEAVDQLGVGRRVSVVRGRSEDLRDVDFEIVTARAVAPLDQLLRWTMPLVAPGGCLLALKGGAAAEEVAAAARTIAALRVGPAQVRSVGGPPLLEPTTVVVVPRPRR